MKVTAKGNKTQILSNSIAVIGISLHNPNHNGYKFKYIIDWVNSHQNFTKCYIDLSDTLYRHNYLLTDPSITAEQALDKARKNGDKWIDRSQPYIDKLNMPHYLIRWDTWRNNLGFNELFNLYYKSYEECKPFRMSINEDISSFFSRKGVNFQSILPKELKHSLNFILEELTCHTLMYRDIKAANIYPGRMLSSYKFIKQHGVPLVDNALNNMTFTRLVYHGFDEEVKSDLLEGYEQVKSVAA